MAKEKVKFLEDLPPERGVSPLDRRLKYTELAQQLRDNPGKWGVVFEDTGPWASNITKGTLRAFRPAGSFEAVSRRTNPSQKVPHNRCFTIYARYVGENA